MPPSDPHRAARKLLLSFGAVAVLVLMIGGLVTATVLGRQAAEDAEGDAIRQAGTVAHAVLDPQLRAADLRGQITPERRAELDRIVRDYVLANGIYKVHLFGAGGQAVYTSEGALGSPISEAPVRQLEREGEFGRVIDAAGRPDGKAIEGFVPVRAVDDPSARGTLEVYIDYGPVAAQRSDQLSSVGLVLLLVALVLVFVLMGVLSVISRRLRDMAVHSEHLAYHDPLTGLPNRRRFSQELEEADRKPGAASFTLAIIDLDGFKAVNDTLGHHHGDVVLKTIAQRISNIVRPHDLVARVGGDEFAVILQGPSEPKVVEAILARIVDTVRTPIEIAGAPVTLGASVGAASSSGEATGSNVLLQQADLAMYVAKNSRTGFEFYCEELGEAENEGHRVAADLRRALGSGELVVYYQPQAAFGGQLTGVEALVRWQHPERGLVPPDAFIGIAERTGLIRPLTFFVLRAALRESARLRANGTDVTMAVNLSALLLQDRSLPAQVVDLLAEEGVAADRLELEITESSLIENVQRAGVVLHELAAHGVRIAVDDWGTGYSSLQHLRELPLTVLKIDRSLISGVGTNDQDTVLVESTIALSRGLGLAVVAEGVETVAMWDMLADLGCDVAQGYLLAKPMPSADLDAWIAGRDAGGKDYRAAA